MKTLYSILIVLSLFSCGNKKYTVENNLKAHVLANDIIKSQKRHLNFNILDCSDFCDILENHLPFTDKGLNNISDDELDLLNSSLLTQLASITSSDMKCLSKWDKELITNFNTHDENYNYVEYSFPIFIKGTNYALVYISSYYFVGENRTGSDEFLIYEYKDNKWQSKYGFPVIFWD